jgi:hypothetical protein
MSTIVSDLALVFVYGSAVVRAFAILEPRGSPEVCLGGSDDRVCLSWYKTSLGDHWALRVEREAFGWNDTTCLNLSLINDVLDGSA